MLTGLLIDQNLTTGWFNFHTLKNTAVFTAQFEVRNHEIFHRLVAVGCDITQILFHPTHRARNRFNVLGVMFPLLRILSVEGELCHKIFHFHEKTTLIVGILKVNWNLNPKLIMKGKKYSQTFWNGRNKKYCKWKL